MMEEHVLTCKNKDGRRRIALAKPFTCFVDAVFYGLDELEPGSRPIIFPIREAPIAAQSLYRRIMDNYPRREITVEMVSKVIHKHHLGGISIACLGNDHGVAYKTDEDSSFDVCLKEHLMKELGRE